MIQIRTFDFDRRHIFKHETKTVEEEEVEKKTKYFPLVQNSSFISFSFFQQLKSKTVF